MIELIKYNKNKRYNKALDEQHTFVGGIISENLICSRAGNSRRMIQLNGVVEFFIINTHQKWERPFFNPVLREPYKFIYWMGDSKFDNVGGQFFTCKEDLLNYIDVRLFNKNLTIWEFYKRRKFIPKCNTWGM